MKQLVLRPVKNDVKRAIRDKYAWPGGYPLFIVTADGAPLCCDCAKREFHRIAWDWARKQSTGWCAIGADINWEDKELTCDHCNERIESAYSDE